MERKWLVYCHTHKETGKKYFGITSKSAKERWGKNGYGYQSSPYFYNATLIRRLEILLLFKATEIW